MPAYALGLIGRKANRPEVIRSLEDAAKSSDSKVREKAREALVAGAGWSDRTAEKFATRPKGKWNSF